MLGLAAGAPPATRGLFASSDPDTKGLRPWFHGRCHGCVNAALSVCWQDRYETSAGRSATSSLIARLPILPDRNSNSRTTQRVAAKGGALRASLTSNSYQAPSGMQSMRLSASMADLFVLRQAKRFPTRQ